MQEILERLLDSRVASLAVWAIGDMKRPNNTLALERCALGANGRERGLLAGR